MASSNNNECETSEFSEILNQLNVEDSGGSFKQFLQDLEEKSRHNCSYLPYKKKLLSCLTDVVESGAQSRTLVTLPCLSQLQSVVREYHTRISCQGKPIRIVLIGETGVGKSTLGNILLEDDGDDDRFWTSPSVDSCTQELQEREGHWLRNRGRRKISVVDTPGLNDAKKDDETIVGKMIAELKAMEYITAFVIVFNGSCPKFTQAHYHMIQVYRSVFGIDLSTNMLLVFTNWYADSASVLRRQHSGISEELKTSEFNMKLREIFETDTTVPCFFVDCIEYKKRHENWEKHREVFERLIETVETFLPYLTIDMSDLKSRHKAVLSSVRSWLNDAATSLEENQDSVSTEMVELLERSRSEVEESVKTGTGNRILKGSRNEAVLEAEESIETQERMKKMREGVDRLWNKMKEKRLQIGGVGAALALAAAFIIRK